MLLCLYTSNSNNSHTEAIDFTLKQLVNPEYKVVESLDEINAIGHRLAHGGEKISESTYTRTLT